MSRTPFALTRLGRFELRRFRGVVPTIALIFVMCVPLLYAAIYLTANWDPYGKLDRLPVAVVNADTGTTVDGKPLNAGDDFVDQLIAQHTFDFRETSADEAARGLRDGDYYLTISVPADFSADLVSGTGDTPERAGIALHRNDANGFVIGTITSRAQSSVTEAVNASAEEAYFTAVFANLSTIRSGLVDARDGSARLATGLDQAGTGASDLATGAGTLATGLGTAKTGAADLSTGLDRLDTGSGQLATGAQQVAAGTQKLQDTVVPPIDRARAALPSVAKDAKTVKALLDGIGAAAGSTTGSVASDLDQTRTSMAALEKAHPELAQDPSWVTAQQRVTSAAGHADTIQTEVDTARTTAKTISATVAADGGIDAELAKARTSVTDLNAGAQQVSTGAARLHTGIHTAATGAKTLSTGISTAADGADRLSTGASTLKTGLATLTRGAHTLNDGLTTGAARIPVLSRDQTDRAVQVLSQPAAVSMTVDNPAGEYGRGLAPMFFAIALWVFGISVFLVVRPLSGRALVGRAGAARLAITGWLPVGAIAVVGSMLMLATVWLTLGLDPVHPVLIVGVTALAAAAFSAVAHLLRTALGTTGSSVLLILLILQLTAGGGTYPAPLLPGFFAAISPGLPMTYLIDAFRVLVSGGLGAHLARDVAVLAGCLLVALTATTLVVRRRQGLSMRDLHPPLVAP